MAARLFGVTQTSSEARTDRIALGSVLLLALVVRLWVFATHTYIAFPDETFQYLEPAHRLAFGSGVITWEYIDGIRSWLLPGLIAAVMRAVSAFDSSPDGYLVTLRLLCIVASLSVPYAGFRIAARHAGPGAAIAAGLLCTLSPQAIYFAPVVMTEPLAADIALLAIVIGDGAFGQKRETRDLLLAGALFGLASALRYQYAPMLGVVALWQHARHLRSFLLVVAGGVAVLVLAVGVVDAATWGMPFQSIWLNYLRNGPQGVSQAMGVERWSFYLEYFLATWGPLTPLVLVIVAFGAMRAPALAILAICTVGLHSIPAHKELRFVFLASASIPMLLGIGLDTLMRRLSSPLSSLPVRVGVTGVAASLIAWSTVARVTRLDDWHRDRSMLEAMAAARAVPGVCGLAVRTVWVYRSAGYSYWHRDVPIYFETWARAQKLPGSEFPLRLESVLNGKPVPQYPDASLAAHTDKFNVIVGAHTDQLPGFKEQSCFGAGTIDDRRFCVFARPGDCG